jgi:hypothetical protein
MENGILLWRLQTAQPPYMKKELVMRYVFGLVIVALVLATAGGCNAVDALRLAPSEAIKESAATGVQVAQAHQQTAQTTADKALARQELGTAAALQNYIGLPAVTPSSGDLVTRLVYDDAAERAAATTAEKTTTQKQSAADAGAAQAAVGPVTVQAAADGKARPSIADLVPVINQAVAQGVEAANNGAGWPGILLSMLGVGITGASGAVAYGKHRKNQALAAQNQNLTQALQTQAATTTDTLASAQTSAAGNPTVASALAALMQQHEQAQALNHTLAGTAGIVADVSGPGV